MSKSSIFFSILFFCSFFSKAQINNAIPDSCAPHPDSLALKKIDSSKTAKRDTTFHDSVTVEPGRLVSVLNSATGHIKTFKGYWASGQNRIPYEDPDYNNPYYEKYALG